jgi:V/A-type H+/Na+-transporting ATPase subunit I
MLLGLLGIRVMKKPGMRQLSRLLVWCGGASVVMGILFGAYFGYELVPALWFDYHGVVAGHPVRGGIANLMDILKITVLLGVGVIAAGLLLNWVNRIRTRDWKALFFAKEGLLGGVIYGAGVWTAAGFAASGFRTFPDMSIAGPLILAPVIVLFLKFPVEAAAAKRAGEHAHSPVMWVMDWAIEMLEIFSGYLANTLSFMRVAGLGIAHVMLMVAFFQIADMVSPGRTSILSVLILLIGNAIVIALEGLSAGIQSLRLNYYEFFSKYFTPTGIEFRPVSLETLRQGG